MKTQTSEVMVFLEWQGVGTEPDCCVKSPLICLLSEKSRTNSQYDTDLVLWAGIQEFGPRRGNQHQRHFNAQA